MSKPRLYDPDRMWLSDFAEYLGVTINVVKGWLRHKQIPEPKHRYGKFRAWTRAEADEIKARLRR